MTPYYSDASATLYHGDCREVLPSLGPITAHLVLADPPYGETSLPWDVPVRDWLHLARAALGPAGSLWCFGSLRSFLASSEEFADWRLAQDVVWEKHNGSIFHADRFRRVHEVVAQFYPASRRWEEVYKCPQTTPDAMARTVRRKRRPAHAGHIEASAYESQDGGPRLMRSVIAVRSCHGAADHPTQKPIGILVPLIAYSCPTGGLVLDPFAGVGSTLVAAKTTGRRSVGVEIDERYCESAARRLSQELPLGAGAE